MWQGLAVESFCHAQLTPLEKLPPTYTNCKQVSQTEQVQTRAALVNKYKYISRFVSKNRSGKTHKPNMVDAQIAIVVAVVSTQITITIKIIIS
jgi:hypothetical protein